MIPFLVLVLLPWGLIGWGGAFILAMSMRDYLKARKK